jgi:hypothetical protein
VGSDRCLHRLVREEVNPGLKTREVIIDRNDIG